MVDTFTVTTAVERCILSILLFTKKALTGLDVNLEWTNSSRLCQVDYAHETLDTSHDGIQVMTEDTDNEDKKTGLCMYVGKC